MKRILLRLMVGVLLPAAAVLFLIWRFALRPQASPAPAANLKTIPYLQWHSAGDTLEKKGVTRHLKHRAWPGFNLYNSRDLSEACLMDMAGIIRHRWTDAGAEAEGWQHIEMLANGDLLVIVKDRCLLKMDWDSRILWRVPGRFHHDLDMTGEGRLVCLSRRDAVWSPGPESLPVLADTIVFLTRDGRVREEISLLDIFAADVSAAARENLKRWAQGNPEVLDAVRAGGEAAILKNNTPPDVLHTNSIEVLKRDIPGISRRGDILVSVLMLDLVAILDRESRRVVWRWGPGIVQRQHHPTLLDNGHILLFDNGTAERGHSRVLEMDPGTGKIVWQYKARPAQRFFTAERGGCQRLPNGNTLITESNRGHVFEVTPRGDPVWEFYNPRLDLEQKKRAVIYRLTRVGSPAPLSGPTGP